MREGGADRDRQKQKPKQTGTERQADRDRQKEIQTTAYCTTKVSQIQVCCITGVWKKKSPLYYADET